MKVQEITQLNAKELILAKINSGNKLAKMYLYMITLGFNINDIVSFMTSPVVSFIDLITDKNIFRDSIKFEDAIDIALGNYSSIIPETLRKSAELSKYIKNIKAGNIDNIKNPFNKDNSLYYLLEDTLNDIGLLKSMLDYNVGDEDVKADVAEFLFMLKGANEFSDFGRILSINLGIATSKVDLLKQINNIKKAYALRFLDANKEYEELDVYKFFTDPDYAKTIKDSYDTVKKSINIFAVIDSIPQYKSIYKLLTAVMDIDSNMSIRSKIYDYAEKQLLDIAPYMTKKFLNNLLKSIDNVFIQMFLEDTNIGIPYEKNTKLILLDRLIKYAATEGILLLNSLSNIATFKYIFENQIIPNLKRGIIIDNVNGEIKEVHYDELLNNNFIKSLILGRDDDMPLYKCDLNMLTIDLSNDSKLRFNYYLKGLEALLGISINGTSLADLFVLYNLIVNKNRYGADRLTTLFDSLVHNNSSLSIILKYLNFIGDLDYKGSILTDGNTITISYNDREKKVYVSELGLEAAPYVKSTKGLNDPYVILNTETGPLIYERVGYNKYAPSATFVPEIENETIDERMERIYFNKAYFTLGNGAIEYISRIITVLNKGDNSTISMIRSLERKGILTILKIC